MNIIKKCLFCFFMIFGLLNASIVPAKTIYFSNLLWKVKEGRGWPGPNNWSTDNVWVDTNGWLHLKITKVGGKWFCPEVQTQQRLGFGQYWFYLIGALDTYDRNIVVGLFHYPTEDVGPDGTNEIDIEFSRWGATDFPLGGYTVYPAIEGPRYHNQVFDVVLGGTHTTHGYTWNSKSILFQSAHGHDANYSNPIYSWTFAPNNPLELIAQNPMPLHLNVWLMNGLAPTNGKSVELIVSKVCYKDLNGVSNCP